VLLCDYNYNFSHRVGDKMGSAFTEEVSTPGYF